MVVLRDGTVVKVVLGQGSEPKFVITDLLPHLGAEQGKKPLNEAIPGENLNILMGSRPLGEEGDSDRVKLRVLDMLHEKYGICGMTSPPPSWRWSPPSTPRIWAWTAASSAHTATATGCAATPP